MHRSPHRTRLGVHPLEDRTVPATFGLPWANPNVTVSFVPDGTPVLGGSPSTLGASLTKDQPVAAWQTAMLSALQTYAGISNLNFGIVADTGAALGAAGKWQGDTRFGDIRVAGNPLGTGVLALGTPPDPSSAGTRGGDVLFNTSVKFGGPGSYNLNAVALHELGHALGLDDNTTDPASVMYATYNGAKAGLTAGDVAAVQALYGVRKADQYEAAAGNDTSATATALRTTAAGASAAPVFAYADLTTAADTDVYSFATPSGKKSTSVTVKVQTTGLSVAAAKLTVFRVDDKGHEADAKTVAMDGGVLGGGSATVTFDGKDKDGSQTWYARVTDADGTKFPVGRYVVGVGFNDNTFAAADLNALANSGSGVVNVDGATNGTLAGATVLAANYSSGPVSRFVVDGGIAAGDVDYYKVTAPAGGTVLTVGVYGFSTATRVDLTDAAGNAVPALVTANSGGAFTVQATSLTPGAAYVVRVTGQTADSYHLTADFGSVASTAQTLSQGAINGGGAAATNTLYVGRTETLSLTLASIAPSAPAGTGTRMTIFDAAGNTVQQLTTWAGDTTGVSGILLSAGTYTVRIETLAPAGFTGPVGYVIAGTVLDDPIGLAVTNPGTGSTTPAPVTYTYPGLVSSSPFIWLML